MQAGYGLCFTSHEAAVQSVVSAGTRLTMPMGTWSAGFGEGGASWEVHGIQPRASGASQVEPRAARCRTLARCHTLSHAVARGSLQAFDLVSNFFRLRH